MPDLESCILYHMGQVEYFKSEKEFKNRNECIGDALQHCPDVPLHFKGPHLYIMEYNEDSGILERSTRCVGLC